MIRIKSLLSRMIFAMGKNGRTRPSEKFLEWRFKKGFLRRSDAKRVHVVHMR